MTIAAPPFVRIPLLKRALLIGGALAGLGGMAGLAYGQAFNGTPETKFGSVAYNRAVAGVETVQVESPTAVIDWRPVTADFLPAGNVATFRNGPNNGDFVVLNRILFPGAVRFDGTVLSRLQAVAGGPLTPGGTIIFSSPGGLIIGGGAVFDVGSLVLTTLNVEVDAGGNFYDPATRGIVMNNGDLFPDAAVVTEPGAQLRALQPNSYIALVGPVIQHGGATRVNGSAAYVAGERVQFRANQGLFDIIVETGSANAVPLVHTGSTGGPASTGGADAQAIYLVAMPKNQAITAVLQGDIGFDPAVSAAIENGEIVLSAGANVVGGTVDRYGHATGTPAADLAASFEIRGGIVRSDLLGVARTDIIARPVGTPSLVFQQDVSLFGGRRAHMAVGAGQTIDVLGNAIVSAAAFDSFDPGLFNLTGGEARIFTDGGGAIHISGTATVDASARGLIDSAGNAGEGRGGTADVVAAGGTITVDGALSILATGEGGSSVIAPIVNGAGGFGGTATLAASGGGTVFANQNVAIDASGTASASTGFGTPDGATGAGGTAQVLGGGAGTITIAGALGLAANGTGGEVLGGAGTGGLGDGGVAAIRSNGGDLNLNGEVSLGAAGAGGNGPNGGRGNGGDLFVEATDGTIDLPGALLGTAGGFGGGGLLGGTGGVGQGGNIGIAANSGTAASRIQGGAITLAAPGVGGLGGSGMVGVPAGTGGEGIGGNISILAESGNGTLVLGAVTGDASGTGGSGGAADNDDEGGAGGTGRGGRFLVGTVGGPAAATPAGSASFAALDLGAAGNGGAGGIGRGAGGTGIGGSVALSATGAPVTVAGATLLGADGRAGAGGDSPSAGLGTVGQAQGGTLIIGAFAHAISNAPGALNLATVTGSADALGTESTGNVAGEWHVAAVRSNVTATAMTLSARAEGSATDTPPDSSLDPQNGTITVAGTAALSTDGTVVLTATEAGRFAGARLELVAGGDVTMSHGAPANGGFTIDVTDLFVQAAGDLTINQNAATRSANLTDLRALGLATIGGRVLGRQINIGSADIDVLVSGQIGDAATDLVVLDVDGGANGPLPGGPGPGLGPNQFTTLGGTTQGPGYTLTGAEAGRIRAGILLILAPALGDMPGRPPDLVVRDLTLNGGGAAGGIGALEIVTLGIARVEGNLLMTGARPQDGIVFYAGERLEVVTPGGSVRVRNGTGAPGGTLQLVSNNIWVAPAGIIELLRADPDYAGRDDDLLDNGGTEAPLGHVEADGVTLNAGRTLFVRNTGSSLPFSTEYAGVTVGAGGLTIVAGGPDTDVYAFGRRLNPDGSFTTGDAFFFQGDYAQGVDPPGTYAPTAALNTCIIVTGQCPMRAPDNPLQGGEEPFTGPTDGSQAIQVAGAEGDDLVDTSFAADALIEEPVTSGSETNLTNCDPDHDGDCDDQPRQSDF